MVRSGQGHLSGSVPSGGLCTDLPQWIQAPARLWSPCLQPSLSFSLPGGPEPWGHPTPLSTCQRDPLTNPCHLWVEGPAWPLEIPSLKPARIFSSRCRGRSRAALSSQSRRPVRSMKDPPARGFQVSPEQKSPSLQYSVASGCRIHRELSPVAVLWVVGSELCVCASFYSAILAPPPLLQDF